MTRFYFLSHFPGKYIIRRLRCLLEWNAKNAVFQLTIQTCIMDLPMVIIGLEFIRSQIDLEYFTAKMVLNGNGALFFPVTGEHREHKAAGISYEDDYRGNALAAMLSSGKMEIRFHKAFSDQRVASIVNELAQQEELEFITNWNVFYQGRRLK